MTPLLSVLTTLGLALAQPLYLRADRVHPVDGPPIDSGAVIVDDGRILAVGPASELPVPAGARELSGAVLTPGLIDGWSTAGLTGPHNKPHDQDHAEPDLPVHPELRALDGVHPRDPLLAWLRGLGITTINAGPSPGQPVSARTVILSNRVAPVDELALVPDAFVTISLGEGPKWRFGEQGASSRMGSAATVRAALDRARDHAARLALPLADRPAPEPGLEALAELLQGKRRALVYAHRADDIHTALRLAEEHGLDIVLAGAAEGWLVAEDIAAAGVPVLVGPVMARSWREGEQRNSSFETAGVLADAGVTVGFLSGHEGYVPKVRVVLWEAAVAGANGLGAERTLQALTLDAAKILGIDDQTGSLTPGKRADLVLFDGDPLEYTSHVCAVVVGGELVSQTCR
jgi:imidazolonepropionase-like amidohydrolase